MTRGRKPRSLAETAEHLALALAPKGFPYAITKQYDDPPEVYLTCPESQFGRPMPPISVIQWPAFRLHGFRNVEPALACILWHVGPPTWPHSFFRLSRRLPVSLLAKRIESLLTRWDAAASGTKAPRLRRSIHDSPPRLELPARKRSTDGPG